MIKKDSKNIARKRRHARIRKNLSGTSAMPRLNVFRSNSHVFAQIIDDESMNTLVSASTVDMKLKSNNTEACIAVGKEIAKRAKAANITKVVFDRGGYLYHGRVKALADAAREEGLEF